MALAAAPALRGLLRTCTTRRSPLSRAMMPTMSSTALPVRVLNGLVTASVATAYQSEAACALLRWRIFSLPLLNKAVRQFNVKGDGADRSWR